MTETALQPVKSRDLVKVGNRYISTAGYHVDLFRQHLETHLLNDEKWCRVSCAARTMFGRDTEANRKKIRDRVRGAFKAMLERGQFMAIEYDLSSEGRGKIAAFKLFEGQGGTERQAAEFQLERMHRRREVSDSMLQQARQVIGVSAGAIG